MGTVEAKGRRIYPEKPSYFFPYGVCWKMGLKIKGLLPQSPFVL